MDVYVNLVGGTREVCDTANVSLAGHFIKHLTAFQSVAINQKLIAFLSLQTDSKSFHIYLS